MEQKIQVTKDNVTYEYVRERVIVTVKRPDGKEIYFEDFQIPPFYDCGAEFIRSVEKLPLIYNEERQEKRADKWRHLCMMKALKNERIV